MAPNFQAFILSNSLGPTVGCNSCLSAADFFGLFGLSIYNADYLLLGAADNKYEPVYNFVELDL